MTREAFPNPEDHSTEEQLAVELWSGINERASSGTMLALPERTVAMTLERYEGDQLGAAMAADITQFLVTELPLDGMLSEDEIDPIDSIVETLRADGIEGISIEDIADILGVDLSQGSLRGILRINEMLFDSGLNTRELLRSTFAMQANAEQAEAEEQEDFEAAKLRDGLVEEPAPGFIYLETESEDEWDEGIEEELDEPEDEDASSAAEKTTLLDESGEEFVL